MKRQSNEPCQLKPDKCAKECDKINASKYFFTRNKRLENEFFNKPCMELAKSLLGKTLLRQTNEGDLLAGRIVEVECYFAENDKSSHSYNFRQTKRNTAMFMKAGTLYVYMTYGMYYCMNISAKGNMYID